MNLIKKDILGNQVRLAHFPKDILYIPPQNKYQRLRRVGQRSLSLAAQMRLEWIIFYHTVGKRNVTGTAQHFGISRKTLHKYLSRFKETSLKTLEEYSRAPLNVRQPTITRTEEYRVMELRKATKNIQGKKKLQQGYRRKYHEDISTHKVQQTMIVYSFSV